MWQRVWIWKRSLKTGTVYYIRWFGQNGKVRSEAVGSDRRLAERRRSLKETEINSGDGPEELLDISWADFMDEEQRLLKGRQAKSSLVGLETILRMFGEARGIIAVSHVTRRCIETYMAGRLETVSVATVNKGIRTLKASLQRAVERGYLHENPAASIRQIREPEREIRVLTPEEVERLLKAAPSSRWRALIALAVTTGMRLGEMLALRWRDLDFEEGTVFVRNTPNHATKSRRNRALALAPEVAKLLKRQK
jgi:integrase